MPLSDRPAKVPALLAKGGEVDWRESIAMQVQGNAYPIPGATGAGEGLEPVTLKSGESVTGEIDG